MKHEWLIYYDDETTFSSEDGTWADAPAYGVQIISERCILEGTPVKMMHMGMDYYLLRDGTLMSFSEVDLKDHLFLGIDRAAIKFGRWTTNEIWTRIRDRAFSSDENT